MKLQEENNNFSDFCGPCNKFAVKLRLPERELCVTRLNFKKNIMNSLKDSWKKSKKRGFITKWNVAQKKEILQPILEYGMEGMSEVLQ